jgi:hypothetical protein
MDMMIVAQCCEPNFVRDDRMSNPTVNGIQRDLHLANDNTEVQFSDIV